LYRRDCREALAQLLLEEMFVRVAIRFGEADRSSDVKVMFKAGDMKAN
jgi:hypothetical protein